MPLYQIETDAGILEIDHDGDPNDLVGPAQEWATQNAPNKGPEIQAGSVSAKMPTGTFTEPPAAAERWKETAAEPTGWEGMDMPIVEFPKSEEDWAAGLTALQTGLEGFTTPRNILYGAGAAALSALGLPEVAVGLFAGTMGKELVSEQIPDVLDSINEKGWTSPETGAALVGAGMTGAMVGALAKTGERPKAGGTSTGEPRTGDTDISRIDNEINAILNQRADELFGQTITPEMRKARVTEPIPTVTEPVPNEQKVPTETAPAGLPEQPGLVEKVPGAVEEKPAAKEQSVASEQVSALSDEIVRDYVDSPDNGGLADKVKFLIENGVSDAQILRATKDSHPNFNLPELTDFKKKIKPSTERKVTTDETSSQKEGQGRTEVLKTPEPAQGVAPESGSSAPAAKVVEGRVAASSLSRDDISSARVFETPDGTLVLTERDILDEAAKKFGREAVDDALKSPMPGSNPMAEMIDAVAKDNGWTFAGDIQTARIGKFADTRSDLIHGEFKKPGTIQLMKDLEGLPERKAKTEQLQRDQQLARDAEQQVLQRAEKVKEQERYKESERLRLRREALARGEKPAPDYQGGPGAMGPVEAGEMAAGQRTTGLAKAVVKDERLKRGLEDLPPEQRQSEEARVQKAEDAVDADPTLASNLITRIVDEGKTAISADDAAVLLVERTRTMNEREMWEDAMTDADATTFTREQAKRKLKEIETRMERLDRAQRAAGSQWGRTGRMYQQLMRDDFTLETLERKARVAKGGPLSEGELAKIQEQAAKIEKLQTQLKEFEAKDAADTAAAERTRVLEATIADLQKEISGQPKYAKPVWDAAMRVAKEWVDDGEKAWEELNLGGASMSSGGIPTAELIKWARVLRGLVAKNGMNFVEASAYVLERLGDKAPEGIADILKNAWPQAEKMMTEYGASPEVKKAVRSGATTKKGEKTTKDVASRAKAEAAANLDAPTQRTAYEAVRAVINSGVKGEMEIMKAAHELLLPNFPKLTPAELDIAFSEYGKAKFPSKEADKQALAKLRRLRQMAAAIEDVKKTGETKKSGLQREKPDADVRKRSDELKAAIEEYGKEVPTTPEQLANRERARMTAAKNAIEDLDRELRTGEAKIKAEPKMPSTELEQLQSELAAMRELRKELKDAQNPPPTPEETYNKNRLKSIEKQIAEAERRVRENDYSKPPKRVPPKKNTAVLDAEIRLDAAKQEVLKGRYEMEQANRTTRRKIWDGIQMSRGAFVNLKSSFDLSAPRQALYGILSNVGRLATDPKTAARNLTNPFAKMFKGAMSEQEARRIEKNREKRPNAKSGAYDLADVQFTSLETNKFTKHEENAHSVIDEWAAQPFNEGSGTKKVLMAPLRFAAKGVRVSNRAFITFLNETRADLMDTLLEANFKDRPPTVDELKMLGHMVNVATGRGTFGDGYNADKRAQVASEIIWAPRLLASRAQLLTGQPLWREFSGKEPTARARSIIAKEYARILGGGFLLLAVSKLFDEKNEGDSTSSDFGKIVRGNTRIDVWGGAQQPLVYASRVIQGKQKTIGGETVDIGADRKYGQRGPLYLTADFIRSKLRPEIGAFVNFVDRKNFVGKKVTTQDALRSLAPIPLPLDGIVKLLKDRGFTEGMIIQMLSEFGAGVQTYDNETEMKPGRP